MAHQGSLPVGDRAVLTWLGSAPPALAPAAGRQRSCWAWRRRAAKPAFEAWTEAECEQLIRDHIGLALIAFGQPGAVVRGS